MFHPLPLFVGLRYARARTHRYFVSFITWVSLAGVCVGVAALIVILSVMNGFESELRTRLVDLSAAVRVTAVGDQQPDWDEVGKVVAAQGGGAAVEPYAELQVLAVRQPEMLQLKLSSAGDLTSRKLQTKLVEGRLEALREGEGIILGVLGAEKLGITAGDRVTMLIPAISAGTLTPVYREFTVAGLFAADVQEHDLGVAYASFGTLSAAGRSSAQGLAIDLRDALTAPVYAQQLQGVLAARWPGMLVVTDWTQEHASYFRAIRIEKTMMALILLLIVAVAAFNIVAMLIMVVNDKRTDIAILRTFGASPRAMAAVFISQGLVIGWAGVLAGVGLGVLIAWNVQPILEFVNYVSGWQMFDADVYLFTEVPSELHVQDVLAIAASALVVTAAATIFPALRAAATSPAEALRYE